MQLRMRLVHIRWLRRWHWIGTNAFGIVFKHENISLLAVIVVTVVKWRLLAKLHRLEDKVIVVELERSAANREKRCVHVNG